MITICIFKSKFENTGWKSLMESIRDAKNQKKKGFKSDKWMTIKKATKVKETCCCLLVINNVDIFSYFVCWLLLHIVPVSIPDLCCKCSVSFINLLNVHILH